MKREAFNKNHNSSFQSARNIWLHSDHSLLMINLRDRKSTSEKKQIFA